MLKLRPRLTRLLPTRKLLKRQLPRLPLKKKLPRKKNSRKSKKRKPLRKPLKSLQKKPRRRPNQLQPKRKLMMSTTVPLQLLRELSKQ